VNERVDDFACCTLVTCARTMRFAEPLPLDASELVMGTKTKGSGRAWLGLGKGGTAAMTCSGSGVCNIVQDSVCEVLGSVGNQGLPVMPLVGRVSNGQESR